MVSTVTPSSAARASTASFIVTQNGRSGKTCMKASLYGLFPWTGPNMVAGSATGLADGVASCARTPVHRRDGTAAMPPDRMRNRLRFIFTEIFLLHAEPPRVSALSSYNQDDNGRFTFRSRRPHLLHASCCSSRGDRVALTFATPRLPTMEHSAVQRIRAWGLYTRLRHCSRPAPTSCIQRVASLTHAFPGVEMRDLV